MGDGLLIVQDGGCVGKVYAVFLEVRSCLPRVPFAIVGHRIHSVCTIVHTVKPPALYRPATYGGERRAPPTLSIEVVPDSVGPTWNQRPAEYSEMAGIRPAIHFYFCVPARAGDR